MIASRQLPSRRSKESIPMHAAALPFPWILLLAIAAVGCSSEDKGGGGGSAAAGGSGGGTATGGAGGGGTAALRATIETGLGRIVVELELTATPITVENFQKYADAQFYDGLIFHRVIPAFMIQGGGLDPDLMEKDPLFPPIVNEAVSSGLSNLTGTIAMARTSAPDSATSQFFINTVDNTYLDPSVDNPAGYCVFGDVVEGMSVVTAIEAVPTQTVGSYENVPVNAVLINSIVVAPL
jgi:cyclophilin family peptidyl-prolyl cis-trans isomerase